MRRRAVYAENRESRYRDPIGETPLEKQKREYVTRERQLFKVMRDPDAYFIGNNQFFNLAEESAPLVERPRNCQLLKAYKQFDSTLLLPVFSSEAKYMPKIVA